MNKKEIGKRLKVVRKKSGLELEDAAFLINKEKRTVNSYETGERTVSLEYLHALNMRYNVNINYILNGVGEMFITSKEEEKHVLNRLKEEGVEPDSDGYLKLK